MTKKRIKHAVNRMPSKISDFCAKNPDNNNICNHDEENGY